MRAGVDFAVDDHALFQIDGPVIKTDDLRFNRVLLVQLQRLAEADGLVVHYRTPLVLLHQVPHAAADQQVEAAQVHQGQVHPVVQVPGHIDVRDQYPHRQRGGVKEPQLGTAAGAEEDHQSAQNQVHAAILPLSNLLGKGAP